MCSILPTAHCRRKAGLRTEITLDGLHLIVCDSEIFHVPERFTVLGQAKILDERVAAVSDHPFQFKPFDKIDLGLPASRFEDALTDVVVTGYDPSGKSRSLDGVLLSLRPSGFDSFVLVRRLDRQRYLNALFLTRR